MLTKHTTNLSIKQTLWFVFISLIWLNIFGMVFPISAIQSKEKSDNPQNCPYYITIQSILANSTLLASDKANVKFIKSRLMRFEKDIKKSGYTSAAVSEYRANYYQALSQLGLNTINFANSDSLILNIARKVDNIVDSYYLDNNIFCVNRSYTWNTSHTLFTNPHVNLRRILQYNLAALYDQLPSRYMRIVGASQDEFQLGVFSGFFVNNQTTSLNIQLMTGIPILTALYVLPKDNFDSMGTYRAVVPWNSFYSPYFMDPNMRKIMNIAGVDVFTVETSDHDWNNIPDVTPVPASINKAFVIASELHTFINKDSYGMAYLANHISYQNPKDIKHYEKFIKLNFARGGRDVVKFLETTSALYEKLATLKAKHDIILESPQLNLLSSNPIGPAGSVEINGIVGERAMFTTDCLRQDCTFVFNAAKAPGWHVFVNGKSTRLDRANFAFMAASVPNGHAVVWFVYQSWAAFASYLFSMICLIGVFFRKTALKNG
ncbi:MAG: hypothetical protein V4501_04575 [Pseudomonadota bacterium]